MNAPADGAGQTPTWRFKGTMSRPTMRAYLVDEKGHVILANVEGLGINSHHAAMIESLPTLQAENEVLRKALESASDKLQRCIYHFGCDPLQLMEEREKIAALTTGKQGGANA